MGFETENEYYDVVHEFPVCKGKLNIYKEKYSSYFKYLCQGMITDYAKQNSHYLEPCEEYLQCLDFLNVHEPSTQKSAYCKFVNYWLNKLFLSIPNNLNNSFNFYNALKERDASNRLFLAICEKEIKNISKSEIYNIEVLYNLHYNLNKYISSLSSGNTSNCYYANASVSIYENHINVCRVHYKSAFCKLLNKFKDQYNQNVSPEKKCDKIKTDLSYLYIENKSDKLQASRGHESSLDGYPLSGNASHKLNSPGKSIATTIVMLLLAPFTLLILYKFTPLGHRLRNLLKGKKDLHENSQEFEEITLNNAEFQENSHGDSIYNVCYNTIINS
ncbi:PIR Superfamily Protein [Plasmodium ovale wallikeri]|uniref:PIR Superfamily Protein n=1 Tax=Plasmodium ovale wallikeri TaxID=864142 RepID=A0A1A9AP12_PLAOA|nr:PIR Superfamily Protein [Plasmodium ovale wallikeri]SBT57971.1 PIR Superfamily Protein [Plasmodium ovale wallikeri]